MGRTSLFFEVENKNVFILGTGEVATRRAHRFLDKGANVILAGNSIDEELTKKGAILTPLKDLDEMVKWSDIVITASGDEKLCEYIASISQGKLINRADKPEEEEAWAPLLYQIYLNLNKGDEFDNIDCCPYCSEGVKENHIQKKEIFKKTYKKKD